MNMNAFVRHCEKFGCLGLDCKIMTQVIDVKEIYIETSLACDLGPFTWPPARIWLYMVS